MSLILVVNAVSAALYAVSMASILDCNPVSAAVRSLTSAAIAATLALILPADAVTLPAEVTSPNPVIFLLLSTTKAFEAEVAPAVTPVSNSSILSV